MPSSASFGDLDDLDSEIPPSSPVIASFPSTPLLLSAISTPLLLLLVAVRAALRRTWAYPRALNAMMCVDWSMPAEFFCAVKQYGSSFTMARAYVAIAVQLPIVVPAQVMGACSRCTTSSCRKHVLSHWLLMPFSSTGNCEGSSATSSGGSCPQPECVAALRERSISRKRSNGSR